MTKANTIRHRNGRIRSTLGIKRRGSYDWAVAEIDNQIKLQGIDYIPKIIGYGTARGKSGIVKSISIVTEFKDNTYNLLEYINKFPNKVHSSIIVSFKLIKRHLDDNLIHLDLWGGNILVNKDLSKSWLIDLELLKRSPKRSFEEKIGFCLGYLYKHTFAECISQNEYKSMVKSWLNDECTSYEHNKIIELLDYSSNNKISKKARFAYF